MEKWKSLPLVSGGLAIINCVIFLLCTFGGDLLYNMGKMDVWNTLVGGEYWRIFTAMFLHGDVNHLFNNMLLVFFLGAMVEKELGHTLYAVVYLLSGLGGNILSLIYKLHTGTLVGSIGASGAVFGLDGVMLALVLISGRKIVDATPLRIAGVIAFSLYSGFSSASVDNAAHVGGLITGLVLGVIISLVIRYKDSKKEREVLI